MDQPTSDVGRPKENDQMTKNTLMKYTLVALSILTVVSTLSWGLTPILLAVIAVAVAVSLDYALSLVMKGRGRLNTRSAAVFGLIVALSYSLANTSSFAFGSYLTSYYMPELLPQEPPMAFAYVSLIAAVGMILFKKLQGMLKRKYVNPAAAAKLLVFLPFAQNVLLAQAHHDSIPLNGPISFNFNITNSTSVYGAFGALIQGCMGNVQSRSETFATTPTDVFKTLTLLKYHGWVGGASSIAVILVGLGLFIVARKYIKWRITLSYFTAVTIMSLVMFLVYGGDPLLRLGFELFIGSSIFLAFFMATDPVTTPDTYAGQGVFGIGLGVLTILIQMYMGFLGGSILALVIMNLTSPVLDRIGTKKTLETLNP
jgi:Na+-translocating ferredoxin:NAD+ oxidoreductase RnfD subunit